MACSVATLRKDPFKKLIATEYFLNPDIPVNPRNNHHRPTSSALCSTSQHPCLSNHRRLPPSQALALRVRPGHADHSHLYFGSTGPPHQRFPRLQTCHPNVT